MRCEGARSVVGKFGLVALEAQGAVESLANSGLIIDYQDMHTSSVADTAEICMNDFEEFTVVVIR